MVHKPIVADVDVRRNPSLLVTALCGNRFWEAAPQETWNTTRVYVTIIDHQEAEGEVEPVALVETHSPVKIDFIKELVLSLPHDAILPRSSPEKIFEL
jgi:hypothetical protein